MKFGWEIMDSIGKIEICTCTALSYFKIGCAAFFQTEKGILELLKKFSEERGDYLPSIYLQSVNKIPFNDNESDFC